MISPQVQPRRRSWVSVPADPPRWLAVAAVLTAAVIWSSSYAVTKVALADVPPLTIGALRFVSAALVLGVIVHARRDRVAPTRRQKARIAAAGLLGITVYFALENVGVDLASASDATLIVASYPVITLIIELAAGRARFSPLRLLGMLLAILGVWVVVSSGAGNDSGGHHLLGDLILLAGGVAWATFSVVSRRDDNGASVVVVTYYQTLAGAGGFVLLSLFESGEWAVPSGPSILRLLFLAVFCSVVAFLAYNYGLRALTAGMAVNLLNIVPVLGLMWAVLLAGEKLSLLQAAGGAIVIAGVSLGLVRTRQERAAGTHTTTAASSAGEEIDAGRNEMRDSRLG
ncbi:DMT family transporter [Amycolatopsis lurida]